MNIHRYTELIVGLWISLILVAASNNDSSLSDKLISLLKRTLEYIKHKSAFNETPKDVQKAIEKSENMKNHIINGQEDASTSFDEQAEKIIDELSETLQGIKNAIPASREFLKKSAEEVAREGAEILEDANDNIRDKAQKISNKLKGNHSEEIAENDAEYIPLDDL